MGHQEDLEVARSAGVILRALTQESPGQIFEACPWFGPEDRLERRTVVLSFSQSPRISELSFYLVPRLHDRHRRALGNRGAHKPREQAPTSSRESAFREQPAPHFLCLPYE